MNIRSKNAKRHKKLHGGYFGVISDKFAEASKMHFENNPTRKIKTKHLRVKSDGERILQEGIDYHLFNNDDHTHSSISNSDMLNKTINIDENNIYGYLNVLNANSEVLAAATEYADSSKIVKGVTSMRTKRDNSFYKYVKHQYKNDRLIHQLKDKPMYKQASQNYHLMC